MSQEPQEDDALLADVLEILRAIIPGSPAIDANTPLLNRALLDSLNIVELIAMLEKRHIVAFEPSLLKPEAFASAASITALLRVAVQAESRGKPRSSTASAPKLRKLARALSPGTTLQDLALSREQREKLPFTLNLARLEARAELPRHAHSQTEIWVITSGTGIVRYGSADPFSVSAGDVLLFTPNVEHRLANTGDKPLELLSVYW